MRKKIAAITLAAIVMSLGYITLGGCAGWSGEKIDSHKIDPNTQSRPERHYRY